MPRHLTFQRRGIVEGFFGPPWSMAHRAAIFEFGARRGMNTYLYAPKDDPYHRERWREPYPDKAWKELVDLILRKDKSPTPFSDEQIHLIENRAPVLSPTYARADPLPRRRGNFRVPFCPTYPLTA